MDELFRSGLEEASYNSSRAALRFHGSLAQSFDACLVEDPCPTRSGAHLAAVKRPAAQPPCHSFAWQSSTAALGLSRLRRRFFVGGKMHAAPCGAHGRARARGCSLHSPHFSLDNPSRDSHRARVLHPHENTRPSPECHSHERSPDLSPPIRPNPTESDRIQGEKFPPGPPATAASAPIPPPSPPSSPASGRGSCKCRGSALVFPEPGSAASRCRLG